MQLKRSFASDNNAGVHSKVLEAIYKANTGHCIGYGDDPFTESALKTFEKHLGEEIEVYFVSTGTAANVLGLKAACKSYHSVICSEIAHLNIDECGSPENLCGCKLVTLPTDDGKITPEQIEPLMEVKGVPHHSQPGVVSITQPTELGVCYTPEEIKTLADFAHRNGMLLHMDGARISNAAAYLGLGLKEVTRDAGVDILSFGGTKNGIMVGEAVVFFNPDLQGTFKFIHKQGTHLVSKMRFLSVQFQALLEQNLWLDNAVHANRMARLLEKELSTIPCCRITQKVESNAVFAEIPEHYVNELRKHYFFYIWDTNGPVVRLMTSFDTREEDIYHFISTFNQIIQGQE